MKAINLHSKHIFRVIFFLTVVTFSKVRNQSLKSISSVTQRHTDLVQLQEVNYVWIVDRLYMHNIGGKSADYFIESPIFSAITDDTFKWYLRLEPNKGEGGKYFNLYLRLSPDSKNSYAWITLDFNIWNDERRSYPVWHWGFSDYLRQINKNTTGWGPLEVFKTIDMFSNNKMKISCEMKYCEYLPTFSYPRQTEKSTMTTPPQVNPSSSKSVYKLAPLFNDEKFADIVLMVNGTKYPAHKAILAAHSPIFAKIFERSLKKGKILKRLNITNTNERVIFEMLRYIYTEKCDNLPNMADQLLAAADKYGLEPLKMICAETLGKNLTVENAAKTLVLANKHSTAELKAKTIGFIVTKYMEVSNTTEWKRIAKKNPELVQDVCQQQHVLLNNMRFQMQK